MPKHMETCTAAVAASPATNSASENTLQNAPESVAHSAGPLWEGSTEEKTFTETETEPETAAAAVGGGDSDQEPQSDRLPLMRWSKQDVYAYLSERLPHDVARKFKEQRINGELLLELTEEDLMTPEPEGMGMAKEDCERLLALISGMRTG